MPEKKPPLTNFEDRVFLGFVVVASLAMLWVSWPFLGAILWGVIAAIMFAPVNDRLFMKMPTRKNLAATLTLLLVIAVVIIPFFVIGGLLIDEALRTYNQLQTREIDFAAIFDQLRQAIPPSIAQYLQKYNMGDLASVQEKLSSVATSAVRMAATQAVNVGQGAFGFAMALGVMLYLTYFLLRDGRALTRKIGDAIPLQGGRKRELFEKFTTVIRATIKGSIVVAVVQGCLGGFIFWALGIKGALLWGVIMGILSLVPAVGAAIVWLPVAIYLCIVGDYMSAAILAGFGGLVIGSVDNILRPILVGADTRMPDYVILITTLGGISVMGINGFIVGPVIAAMFISSWEIFTESRSNHEELA
jgi:predicted PurR-regulated permease PerM